MIDEKRLMEDIHKKFSKDSFYIFTISVFEEIVKNQPQADKWIPVDERLPKFKEEVLVDCGDIDVYFLERGFNDVPVWEDTHGEWHDLDSVFAWQPLPTPYKKEGVNND